MRKSPTTNLILVLNKNIAQLIHKMERKKFNPLLRRSKTEKNATEYGCDRSAACGK